MGSVSSKDNEGVVASEIKSDTASIQISRLDVTQEKEKKKKKECKAKCSDNEYILQMSSIDYCKIDTMPF